MDFRDAILKARKDGKKLVAKHGYVINLSSKDNKLLFVSPIAGRISQVVFDLSDPVKITLTATLRLGDKIIESEELILGEDVIPEFIISVNNILELSWKENVDITVGFLFTPGA